MTLLRRAAAPEDVVAFADALEAAAFSGVRIAFLDAPAGQPVSFELDVTP